MIAPLREEDDGGGSRHMALAMRHARRTVARLMVPTVVQSTPRDGVSASYGWLFAFWVAAICAIYAARLFGVAWPAGQ